MRIDIITLLPKIFEGPLNQSIVKRAQDSNLVDIFIHDLRDFSKDKHKSVDDYQYGGGAGMVLMVEPIARCIESLSSKIKYDEVIYMSPDGISLNQSVSNKLSLYENLLILCGHYKGVDERVRKNYITMEISVGDYVLSGGELAAAVLADSVIRLIPGVLSDETSALTDSFQDGLLAPPVYTRPSDYKGMKVPPVLLSGNAAKIEEWRQKMAMDQTKKKRPNLLE